MGLMSSCGFSLEKCGTIGKMYSLGSQSWIGQVRGYRITIIISLNA